MIKSIILKECEKIENEDIKNFAESAINRLPEYFFSCAASSTGKYHPTYALGDGGLVRHTIAAVRFVHHMFNLEHMKNDFTDRERDCMIAAILLHDGWKHGNKNSGFTVHEHPKVCMNWILENEELNNMIPEKDLEIICSCISSHMGEWCQSKKSSIVLDKPTSKYQKLVHMCDYLASRKDIEVLFDDQQDSIAPKIEEFIMPYGKHKEKLLIDIYKTDKGYLKWMKANIKLREPLKGFIDELLKEDES